MEKNEIFLIHGTDYKEMTKTLLCQAKLENRIPAKTAKIGVKPNLVSPTPASFGATTHPEIVAGILEYLKERGYENLTILEGSWVGDKTEEAFEVCGYQELARQYQVRLVDAQKDGFGTYDCAGLPLRICHSAKEIDFMINVPVMKGHCQTKITCALKNMKGLIPNTEKRRFHSMGLHKPIAHLGVGIRQDFIVVDNICGDWDFEDGGNPVVMNRIFAAADPVLCDAFVCREMHYSPEEIPYLVYAKELGVGSADLGQARLHFCNRPKEQGAFPEKRKIVELQDAVCEVESCSACYGYLIPALDMLKAEGLFEKLDEKICIGQGFRGKKGNLGVGQCTRGFTRHLPGCPPTENQIYEFLKSYIQEKNE